MVGETLELIRALGSDADGPGVQVRCFEGDHLAQSVGQHQVLQRGVHSQLLARYELLERDPGIVTAARRTREQDVPPEIPRERNEADRKSTRLNSSHANISYAVF